MTPGSDMLADIWSFLNRMRSSLHQIKHWQREGINYKYYTFEIWGEGCDHHAPHPASARMRENKYYTYEIWGRGTIILSFSIRATARCDRVIHLAPRSPFFSSLNITSIFSETMNCVNSIFNGFSIIISEYLH